MIISQHGNQLFLVTQPEHCELVGQIAAQWGNALFARSEPYRSMVVLAAEHDHSWVGEDNQPSWNEVKQCPHDYISLPYAQHIAIYQKGTRDTAAHDAYAGLLLSMHGLGIYNQRFGTDSGQIRVIHNESEQRVINDYIVAEESYQTELKKKLIHANSYSGCLSDSHLWTNYLLMQVWDRLGLLLCKRQEVDFTLEPVPTSYRSEERSAIEFKWQGDNVYVVKPYPFAFEEVTFHFKGRYLRSSQFASHDAYLTEYYSALRTPVSYRLIKG